jgi:dihydrodipicolinate synthase/N-acetylneuraminate lyase
VKPTRRGFVAAWAASMAPRWEAARAAAPEPMRGIFIIMTTPYTESKQVDYEDLAKEVDFLERAGAHGMVWPQLGSEVWSLTKEERMRGMEVLAKAARGKRCALVLGVQGANRQEAIEYTERAEALEPAALIAIPPREAKSLEDVRDYYHAIASRTRRPVIVQTTGGARGLNIDAQFIASLVREHPHCGYVKEEAPPVMRRIRELLQMRPLIRRVYGGADAAALFYEMRVGADGNMPNAAYADVYAQIWDLFQAGQQRKALDLYSKTLLLTNLRQQIPGTPLYLMKKRGVFKNIVSRQQEIRLTPEEIEEIEFNFEMLKPYLRA